MKKEFPVWNESHAHKDRMKAKLLGQRNENGRKKSKEGESPSPWNIDKTNGPQYKGEDRKKHKRGRGHQGYARWMIGFAQSDTPVLANMADRPMTTTIEMRNQGKTIDSNHAPGVARGHISGG